MIRLVSENPLKYVDDEGNELKIEEIECPLHKNKVKFVRYKDEIIMVQGKQIEMDCEAWRQAIKE